MDVDTCLDAAAVVIGQWSYTHAPPGADPCCDVRARLRRMREEETRIKLPLFSVKDILNPQPHAAAVVHALLVWIDTADKTSQRGKARPAFSRPDGSPIFPPDEEWWVTSFEQRSSIACRPDLAGDDVPDEDLTLDPADAVYRHPKRPLRMKHLTEANMFSLQALASLGLRPMSCATVL